MAKEITCTIDGKECTVPEDMTILDAARGLGIEIPTFCHNDELKPYGSCFVCVVELEGRPGLVPSCATKVSAGMKINASNDRVMRARKMALDLLLSDHVGDCLGPCLTTCPGGCDIPGFINHIREGRERDALELIKHDLSIPASLGRICPRPCEDACRRNLKESPLAICHLKRYAADVDLQSDNRFMPEVKASTGKHVAIIGAGPAGISAAYYLLQWGHKVTIYESHPKPGGMMRYGIPAYRLPRDIIDQEVWPLEQMGATINYNTTIGKDISFDQLRSDFDAVFVGIGAQRASSMRVEGETLPGVSSGIEFLEKVSDGSRTTIGDKIMVVGGGNTAIDAARSAVRLGAKEVCLLYRRTRKEMPAWEIEIEEAEHEGVDLQILAAPVKVETAGDQLKVTCIKMELGEPDSSGRRRPVPIQGSEYDVMMDEVIAAIGQGVDANCLKESDIELTSWSSVVVNENTLSTNLEGVFAGGDCVTGPDIAIRAVGAGRLAAISIDQFVRGEKVIGDPALFNSTMGKLKDVPRKVYEDLANQDLTPMPVIPLDKRTDNFDEVETGYEQAMAVQESKRCMECGCRAADDCKLRDYATDFNGNQAVFAGGNCRGFDLDISHPLIRYESGKCIQCGTCVRLLHEKYNISALGFSDRGFGAKVVPPFGGKLADYLDNDEAAKDIAKQCPTGALMLKGTAIQIRPHK